MSKAQMLEAVQSLPEDADLDDLFEKLIFIEKVEEGLQAIEEGRVVSLEEAKRRLGIL